MLWNESAIERGQGFVSSSTFAEHPQLSVSLFDDSLWSRRDPHRVAGLAFRPVLQQLQERIVHTPKKHFRALDPSEPYGVPRSRKE
jgi:hypothetical protein